MRMRQFPYAMTHASHDSENSSSLATFGGGCFWCTEAMFAGLKGVISATSGYSGGNTQDPNYREVCSGATGHAEVIQIEYDAQLISYKDLLKIHMGSHDPTTLNSQGADHGTQYRSIILIRNEEERQLAKQVINEYAETLEKDVVTEIKDFEIFYAAEDNHQNYYAENPNAGYCSAVISPKLAKFRQTYQHLLR